MNTGRPSTTADTLDEIAVKFDANLAVEPLAEQLGGILSEMPREHPSRPKALRLMGLMRNRLGLPRDALGDLAEARGLASRLGDYNELAAIARAFSVVYGWRGDGSAAAMELLHALVLARMADDQEGIARALSEAGRIEMEMDRPERAAFVIGRVLEALADHLPPRELARVRVNRCQALNRLGLHQDALAQSRELLSESGFDDSRLRFLCWLENARANLGLARHEDVERALRAAEALIPDKPDPFERTEFLHVQCEFDIKTGETDARPALQSVIDKYDDDQLVTRAILARILMADANLARQHGEGAQANLAAALNSAIVAGHLDLADRIRSRITKSSNAADFLDMPGMLGTKSKSAPHRQFVLRGAIGSGGFGHVFRAIDLADGCEVAIKRFDIFAEFDTDRRQQLLDSIKTEYSAASKISHPGIARVRDLLAESNGAFYLVQDFIDGATLRSLLASATSFEAMLTMMANLTQALAALHAKGVVHRDLKPENVMVRKDGLPVIIDLGIACLANAQGSSARIGTPGYVAPEQAAGRPVDARADIYSLGRMIDEVWIRCCENAPQDRSWWGSVRASPGMPKDLRRCVGAMVAAEPERRPDLATIAAVLRASVGIIR